LRRATAAVISRERPEDGCGPGAGRDGRREFSATVESASAENTFSQQNAAKPSVLRVLPQAVYGSAALVNVVPPSTHRLHIDNARSARKLRPLGKHEANLKPFGSERRILGA